MTLWSAQEWALAASLCRQSAAPAGGSSHTGIKPVLTFKSKTSSQLTRTKDNTASKQKHKNNNNKNNKINNYFYFYYNKSFEASGVSAG